MTLRHAFKEWSSVCRALAVGQQTIILRKGGIADPDGLFVPEHSRFWLYPTFSHQQTTGLKPRDAHLLTEIDSRSDGILRLTHFAEVTGVYQIAEESAALLLDDLHVWSEATVKAKFVYRRPGLWVLPARVFAVPQPVEVAIRPEFDGCKTWVDLGGNFATDGAVSVVSDATFAWTCDELDRRLNPTALA